MIAFPFCICRYYNPMKKKVIWRDDATKKEGEGEEREGMFNI